MRRVIDTEGKRTEMRAASEAGPCSACPWRASNHGKRHPDGWYTKANLRRLWAGLRRGERMTCHPTDPANPVPDGARPVPDGTATRECTGALVLVQRELQRVQDVFAADGSLADYRRAHPRGLTNDGVMVHVANLVAVFPGDLPMAKPDLNDDDVSHPDLVPWEPRTAEAAAR